MHSKPVRRYSINPVSRYGARFLLWTLGWKVDGTTCEVRKCVVIAAPHKTNWDLFYTLLSAAVTNMPIWFMMKHSHFWWPLNIVWRYLGGVPINRSASTGVVEQLAKEFSECDQMYLVVPPTGTRKKVDHWRTGFYYIAHAAGVPVWPWYINYETKMTGSGPLIYTTGDLAADFERIRAFYEEKVGRLPECRPPTQEVK